jgi:hypothetical protein
MMFVFDTSSFVSLARYYLPFDSKVRIYQHVKSSIENGRIVLIDAVLEECRYVAGRIVVEKLDFLADKDFLKENSVPMKTKDIVPAAPVRFYNMVENNFATPAKNNLTEIQFEKLKQEFLASADARMVMYAYNYKHENPDSEIFIVTEEIGQANDNKAFKKLPSICDQLNIPNMALPEYLDTCEDLNMSFG